MLERFMPDVPDELWDRIISLLDHDSYLEPLSIVSKSFLSITNRLKQTLIISDPTLNLLPRLFNRFPNVKNISFSNFHGCPDSIFRLISQTRFPLESLDLSNHRNFPSEAIRELPRSCLSSIRSLKLRNVAVVNDLDLGVISELMNSLEEIDLSDPNDDYWGGDLDLEMNGGSLGITDYGVDLLASKLSNLKKINLSGNYMVSDKSIESLSEKCMNLEEIGVKNCTFVTQNGMSLALRSCVNLTTLDLRGIGLGSSAITDALVCARKLSVLDFSYMVVSDAMLIAIAKASIPLKKLTLFHCKDFTFVGVLSLLRSYPNLDHLALEGAYWLSDRSIIDLSKFLRKATTIKLNFCLRLTSSALFTMLKNCPELSSLEMENAGMGEQAFTVRNVSHPGIRSLVLGSNKPLSNECLENISVSCPNLEMLNISDCSSINRKGIGEIVRNCTNLRHLQMSGCRAIKSLGIDVKLAKLERLEASGSGLNDEGLIVIAKKCPALMYLDLMNCSAVTSKGVKEVVYQCQRLKEINLHWCRGIGHDIVHLMVFSRPSLRKIVPPYGVSPTESEKALFLLHGCHVCEP